MPFKSLLEKREGGPGRICPSEVIARLVEEKLKVERYVARFVNEFNGTAECSYVSMLFRHNISVSESLAKGHIPNITWRLKKAFNNRLPFETKRGGYVDLFDENNPVCCDIRRFIQSEAPNMYELLVQWEHLRVMLLLDCTRVTTEYRVALKLKELNESRAADVVVNREALKKAKAMMRSVGAFSFDRLRYE